MEEKTFGKDFVWGAATSALQTEGSLNADGRGESVWDQVYLKDGPGDESYKKIDEDIALLKELGVKAYRFSLSWTRLFPEGTGSLNRKGADFYLHLVKDLLADGIEPYVTLFHWDYPLALELKGGWLNKDSPLWFEEYARGVGRLFNGLVKNYLTINEPQCFLGMGHYEGSVPPYHQYRDKDLAKVIHNVLLGSGLAVRALRAASSLDLKIMMANTYLPSFPANPANPDDIEAARLAYLSPKFNHALFSVSLFADPAFLGRYDRRWLSHLNIDIPYSESDMKIIQADYDYFGINIYSGYKVVSKKGQPALVPTPDAPHNYLNWEIHPEALYYGPKYLFERYRKPIFITENGSCCGDKIEEGLVHDLNRMEYLRDYLRMLGKVIKEGTPVAGYFYWSLLDNFEWNNGYRPRFGLVFVDYEKGARRLPKDSFFYFKKVIASDGGEILKDQD
jgi:beta-glucosidase